jgi:gluconolactonase
LRGEVIYKWRPDAPLSVFLERSGFTGSNNLNAGQQTIAGRLAILLIGSNGLALDAQGRLIITAMADRTLVRLEKDGSRTTLADRYDGNLFSGPNDVVVKSNGSIYFTDSVNGLRGGGDSPQRELPYNGFYLVKDGKVTLVGGDRDRPGDFPNASRFRRTRKCCMSRPDFARRWSTMCSRTTRSPTRAYS